MDKPRSILERWELSVDELTELVDANPSLRGMMSGYIAEKKFHDMFLSHPDITEIAKDDDHDRKMKGDRRLLYKGRKLTIEVKSLQTAKSRQRKDGTWTGKAQVDASDRRIITFNDGSKLNTTLLLCGEFDLLAVSCFAFEGTWRFVFAKNSDLPNSTYRGYTEEQRRQLIASLVPVTWPPTAPFYADPFPLLDELARRPEEPSVEAQIQNAPSKKIKKAKKTSS